MTASSSSSHPSCWRCWILPVLLLLWMGSCWSFPYGTNHQNNKNNNNNNKSRRNSRRRQESRNIESNDNSWNGDNDDDDDNVLRLVKVSCHDEWYEVRLVVTMGQVLTELERQSPLSQQELQTSKLFWRGKIVEDHDAKLKEYGIREGDAIFCRTENYQFRPHEVLAMALESMAKDLDDTTSTNTSSTTTTTTTENSNSEQPRNPLPKLLAQLREQGLTWDYWKAYWEHVVPMLDKAQVSHAIRMAVDLSYHRLRMFWEQPAVRRALQDPAGTTLETYRQVLANHLPKAIQKELPPHVKQFLADPEAWRRQIQHVLEGILKLGDAVLDGLLDIVLDVVQGAGKTSLSSRFSPKTTQTNHHHYEPNMEDPTNANQMLFELSESEDEN